MIKETFIQNPNLYINIVLLGMLLIVAVYIVLVKNLLSCTIMLSIFSFLMALIYLVLDAPDVAMTEAAVGAGISTILFLAILILTGEKDKGYNSRYALPVVLLFMAILFYSAIDMPEFGSKDAPIHKYLAPYYIKNGIHEIGIPSVVTSILASYRGYDTLGEVAVIFTAGISVLLILKSIRKED